MCYHTMLIDISVELFIFIKNAKFIEKLTVLVLQKKFRMVFVYVDFKIYSFCSLVN